MTRREIIPIGVPILFYVLAAIAGKAAGAPTTQPTTNPVYLQGWIDAGGIVAKPTPPAPVNTVTVKPTDDLTAILNASKDGITYQLGPGVYNSSALATINASGVKLVGAGSAVTTIKIVGTATAIELRGANPEISGITFDSNKPIATAGPAKVGFNAIHVICASAYIHDCVGANVDDFALIEDPATNCRIYRCNGTDAIRGDFIFSAHKLGLDVEDCVIVDSKQEHGIRLSSSATNQGTANVKILRCTIGNTDGKEAIAVRGALGPVDIENCTFSAWVRAGQVVPAGTTPPTFSVGALTIKNCHFTNHAYLAICQGVTADVESNQFDGYLHLVGVTVQGPHAVAKIVNNVRTAQPGQVYTSAFVQQFTTSPGDVVESGTVEK